MLENYLSKHIVWEKVLHIIMNVVMLAKTLSTPSQMPIESNEIRVMRFNNITWDKLQH